MNPIINISLNFERITPEENSSPISEAKAKWFWSCGSEPKRVALDVVIKPVARAVAFTALVPLKMTKGSALVLT